MKQEILFVWKRYCQKRHHCLRARGYNPVLFCKKPLFQELPSLSSSDGNFDSAALYQGMAQSDVKHKTFWGENIVANQDVSFESFDQVEFASNRSGNLLSLVALSWKKKKKPLQTEQIYALTFLSS